MYQLEIVRVVIGHRFPAPDFGQPLLCRRHGPPKGKRHPSLELSRYQSAWGGVHAHPDSVKVLRHPATAQAAIKSGYHSNLVVRKWSDRVSQVTRVDANVAVAHDQEVVFRFTREPAKA